MTKDEALTLALEALEDAAYEWSGYVEVDTAPRTLLKHLAPRITAIKEALAQPGQKPVAAYTCGVCGVSMQMERPWVGLTEVDILAASKHWRNSDDFAAGVDWAEITLKEKNT